MILDTSAVCAIAFGEPEAEALLEALEAQDDLAMSAATYAELTAVLARSRPVEDRRRVERLLEAWGVDVVAFDADQARVAAVAYQDYGRGSGHVAALNLGDCYAYALAVTRGEALLCVGDDLRHTDATLALRVEASAE